MTDLLGLPDPLLLLLPLALAAGTDLYLTLLILSLATWIGGWPPGAEAVSHLGGRGPLLLLAVLYLAECLAELRPVPALLWHNIQLLLRPMGGFLLGILLLEGDVSLGTLLLGAVGAGVVAACAHVLSWGGGLLLRLLPPGRVSPFTLNLFLDTCTLALVVLALEERGWAFLGASLILALCLLLGGPLHGVTRFGFGLLEEEMRGFSSPSPWRGSDQMPRWVRRGMGKDPGRGFRGMRAGAMGIPGTGRFKAGWLVERGPEDLFLFSSTGGRGKVSLKGLRVKTERPGALALHVTLEGPEGGERALFLQKKAVGLKSHKWR